MFELQSLTYFGNHATIGHATVIANYDQHISKFEIIFKRNNVGDYQISYETNVHLDKTERKDFERWLNIRLRRDCIDQRFES